METDMKKILALLLCMTMLVCTFAGCGGSIKQNAEDKGAEIPVYIASEVFTLDPAYAYLDDASAKIMGLLYEGLFVMNEDGKPENLQWVTPDDPVPFYPDFCRTELVRDGRYVIPEDRTVKHFFTDDR